MTSSTSASISATPGLIDHHQNLPNHDLIADPQPLNQPDSSIDSQEIHGTQQRQVSDRDDDDDDDEDAAATISTTAATTTTTSSAAVPASSVNKHHHQPHLGNSATPTSATLTSATIPSPAAADPPTAGVGAVHDSAMGEQGDELQGQQQQPQLQEQSQSQPQTQTQSQTPQPSTPTSKPKRDPDADDSAQQNGAPATPSDAQSSLVKPDPDGDHSMTDAANGAISSAATANQPLPSLETQQASQFQNNEPSVASANLDQQPPSTPYTPANIPDLDQQAYMMMALASMSQAPAAAMSPPPTVTPSQVTMSHGIDGGYNGMAPINASRQGPADKGLESFARIEFADSVFQMTTYAVIVGRDQRALVQARRDEKRAEEHRRRTDENASKGLPPPSPIGQDRSKFSKSYVSEEGGMLGPESDSESGGRPTKRRKTSTAGSSNHDNDESQENMISNRQYVSHTPGAAAVDLTSLRPSPWHVPFIGIHSPGPDIASKTKAISREHLKIAYNESEGVFEAIPLHKNGFFCQDVHYKSDKVILRSGDRLQIKDVDFRFIINGVEKGRTGAEDEMELDEKQTAHAKRHGHGGKEMSFDFEHSHGDGEFQETSDELSDVGSQIELSDFGDDDGDEEEETAPDGQQGQDSSGLLPATLPDGTPIPQIPKKRGPGRPPKNGIMSKREQRLLKKQQQELEKKAIAEAPPVEPPVKRKVGRPRKHPLPEDGVDRPEKRKYKPRKPKDADGAEGSDAERRAKEKKDKKVRPKSPPLELKIEDYTEEQLQKPNKNYGVLIDETLTAAPDGLTLKQIYKRICQRYPWFYFHTETKGWESSVRHNLIGNEAFKKDEVTNLWSRVPGVELDAGKKRKASSPDRGMAAQGYGPYSYAYNPQHLPPGVHGIPPGQVPPGYQMPGYNPQQAGAAQTMQQQYANSASPSAPGAQPLASQPPAPAQIQGYGTAPPPPARAQPGAPQMGTAYSSPYASRPPPAANPQIKTEDGRMAPAPAPGATPGQGHVPLAAANPGVAGARPIAGPAGIAPQQQPQQQQQQPQQQAGARPQATPPTTAPSRPVIDPRLLQAVVGLKNGLIENLKKARNPKAEGIVMSALNRCIGLKKEATENDKMETICIKGIRQVIDGFTKHKSPTPGGSTVNSPDAPPPIFEPKVFASLTGFKDVSVRALKGRLGEARAEAVTLSAIDRVLGLADASIVPPAAEGESTGHLEGVEQHLIKSIRQLLLGMNQKLSGTA